MNRRMVLFMLGRIIMLEAFILMLPAACSLIYKEKSFFAFLITIVIAFAVAFVLSVLNKPRDKTIFAKEGFVIVSLAWICFSAVGALPFVISGEIPSFIDAFFETVSGFTTTGASILTDVESKSHGILFWRSFTHWVGGMGVLVLMMAIFPTDTGRTIHIMRAEMPGPIIGKLVPKIKSTAKILYLIYIVLTATEALFLLLGGMSPFESIVYSLGTAGTGGFGIKSDGLASYTPYQQWVITVFMVIFGINFNLYYLVLTKKVRSALKSEELWFYLTIVATATVLITVNIYDMYGNTSDALRNSAFQVASLISTTGYATADFNLWPTFSKGILFLLMFTGACAGSTAGGLKLSRVILLFKSVRSNLKHMLHTRSVESIRFEGKKVDNATITNVASYFALYMLCIAVILLLLCLEPFDLETNISAAVSCFNNIGPGFSSVGPMSSYAEYSDFAKLVLSCAMLLGRLEIYPMLLMFSPTVWRNRIVRS
ncbi:MAG: TrkH family potassium uptake protein [Acutalibacteraceae bacterium]|nr:TrkH family potassium uptake protein [Acutalibacteraceae bacterium]